MNKLTLNDDFGSAMFKISQGNPGAITVIMEANIEVMEKKLREGPLAPFTVMMALDTLGIYGPNIWILYKDKCDMDIVQFLNHINIKEYKPC